MRSKPWTLDPPNPKDHELRGSEADLSDALGLLAPFQFTTAAEAAAGYELRQPPYPGQRPLWWLSAEEARMRAIVLAVDFNWQTRLERNAPRVATVIESLRRVDVAAEALRQELLGLDDYARFALQTAGSLLAWPEGRPVGQAGELY